MKYISLAEVRNRLHLSELELLHLIATRRIRPAACQMIGWFDADSLPSRRRARQLLIEDGYTANRPPIFTEAH